MLNKDLFTKHELEIAKYKAKIAQLEKTISAFKEYDCKRKKYYEDSMNRLGKLEAYVQELEDTSELVRKNKSYKQSLTILNKRVFLDKIARMSDAEVNTKFTLVELSQQLAKRDATIKTMRKTIDDLIIRLRRDC